MRVIIITILAIFLSSCAISPQITSSKSAIILLKTPKIKYHDTGFINNYKGGINIKVLSTGVEVLAIDIDRHICLNSTCFTKEGFNSEYLSQMYDEDMLENIFRAKKILNGKNYTNTKDGFSQYIKTDNYDIKYIVSKGNIYFKDYKNSILIKVSLL